MIMSEAEARVVQEGAGQRRPLTDASKAAMQRSAEADEIRRTHIGKLARLHVAPDLLKRIQLGSIGRQTFDRELRIPAKLNTEIGHRERADRRS